MINVRTSLVASIALVIATASRAMADAKPLPKVTIESFKTALTPRGYAMESHLDDPSSYVYFLKQINETRYSAEMYCNADKSPRRINAAVTTTIDKQIDPIAAPELAAMAAAVCGASADDAAKWVRSSIGQNAERTFAGVHLKLEAPTRNGRLLSITAE